MGSPSGSLMLQVETFLDETLVGSPTNVWTSLVGVEITYVYVYIYISLVHIILHDCGVSMYGT